MRSFVSLVETIRKHLEAKPVAGPAGAAARCLAVAAKGLTQNDAEETVPLLLTWLTGALAHLDPKLSWYTVRPVLAAIARLAPRSEEVRAAIVHAGEVASSVRDLDESGVLDFERELGRILTAIGDQALWDQVESTGSRPVRPLETGSKNANAAESGGPRQLPAFPPEGSPPAKRPLMKERNSIN